MEQNNNAAYVTPTIADLIKLLDQATLNVLAERLQKVAAAEEEAPEQMLLSFLDGCLTAHEEAEEFGMDRVEMAEAILEELPTADMP